MLGFGTAVVYRLLKSRFQHVQSFTARLWGVFWRCTRAKMIGLVVVGGFVVLFISDFKRDFSTYSRFAARCRRAFWRGGKMKN